MNDNNNALKCLSHILTDEEIQQMPSDVRLKLESHLEANQLSFDNMKNQLSKYVTNEDKKSFAVDRELQNTKSKLNMAEEFADKLKNQLRETEEALQKSRHEYYETLECKESLSYELKVIKEKMERFTNEKLDFTQLLERRLDEIKSLQMEVKSLSSKLHNNNEGKIENSIKAEEMQMREISIQYQEKRLNEERVLYQKQIAALNEELHLKVNELLTLRRERAVQLFELQSNLEQKSEEHSQCMEEMKHLKQVVVQKDKHIESLATRIREMQRYSAQLEEDYQNEITAQNNLIELHKQSSLDSKKRNDSLVETIEEMQKLLLAAQQAHNELESTFNESQIKFTEQMNKSIEENNALIKELEEMKETTANSPQHNLEAEFEKQYPFAAQTKKILSNNMSFTQIFNQLIRAQQELEDQKVENNSLKEMLERVSSEAEENAPLLHRKIQEHQRAVQSICELQNQISSLITEREQWLKEKDTIIRINQQYEREVERYERENLDLGKQIRALIKSVQEARGFAVSHEQDSQISSSDSYRNIPQQLITFRDIEELQTNNQKLMNALREEREKIVQFQEERNDSQSYALQKNLDEAILQLENLRKERREQSKMVEDLIKQRDLYKVMVSHSNEPNQMANQRSPVAFTSSTRNNTEENNELKSNFDKINKEYANFREESYKRNKTLTEANDKLREEISSSKIEIAKISSELAFTQERLEILKTNMEQFQRENALLREKNCTLHENVKKHEQSLVLMRQDVLSAQEKVNRLEMTNESLKAERDLFRNNEWKLLQEKEILIRNQENQNKLITTLQSVQSNLSFIESDSVKNLKILNNKSEEECLYLKNRYEKEKQRHSEAISVLEKQSSDLQTRVDTEIEKYWKLHQELTEYQTKIQKLETEINSLRTASIQTTNVDKETESEKALQSQMSGNTAANGSTSAATSATTSVSTQNTIAQLRKVARKYKQQFDDLKVELDQLKDTQNKLNVALNTEENNESKIAAQESQIAELSQNIEVLNNKVLQLNEQIEKQNIDLIRINEEKEAAKSQANEKEEKAKKIAHQAKQRLAILSNEKINLFRDKEMAEKSIEELKEKLKAMEQNCEESALRMASIKSQYDAKTSRLERELFEAHKQIEEFKVKLQSTQQMQSQQQQQQQQQLQQQTSTAIAVTAPVQASAQPSSNPVRHSVHPQQSLSAKSTPTASIRPLTVAPTHVHRTARTAAVSQSRTATVATVQPTTEESSHQSVPHATVQPTQTVTSQMVFIPPTSTTESEIITAHNEEDSLSESNNSESNNVSQMQRPIEQNFQLSEIVETNNSAPQPSTKEDNLHLSAAFDQNRLEEPEPSTSMQMEKSKEKVTLKRSRKTSEEALIPFSPKRICVESESDSIRTQSEERLIEETSDRTSDSFAQQSEQSNENVIISTDEINQTQNFIKTDKERVEQQNVDNDDDDVIILESDDSDEEQRVDNEEQEDEPEEEDDEEEEEEEEYDDAEEEDNVEEEGSEEVYNNEDFNEEMSNDSHYGEEVNEEQNEDNERGDEEIEIIGVSDDMPEQNQDVIDQQISVASHQQSIRSELISSEPSEVNVSTTSSQVTSNVTSSTESIPIGTNPFMQLPTPIQRPFASGRQSFYISHAQQSTSYDEGDGIVPSTPTLFVPRRGDSFADALNSPRVPQGRFVFSSSIPEASALSQLASEGTLGVDDTRMDLSQFDDNGRSVPTTPLAVSPSIDNTVHSTVQSSEMDQSSDQTYNTDPNVVNETPITTEFDNENSGSSRINVESDSGDNSKTSIKDNIAISSAKDVIETNEVTEAEEEVSEQLDNEIDSQNEDEVKEVSSDKVDDNTSAFRQDSEPTGSTSTGSGHNQRQTARRGRAFGTQRVIQRRPIVWPTESSGEASPNKPPMSSNSSQVPQQPQSSHPSAGRRIRLRGSSSKFSTRGDFRGGRPGRGSRGSYHYSK